MYVFLLLIILHLYGRASDKSEHILQGNLALPTSQQLTPLFSLGQNIVEQVLVTPNRLQGQYKQYDEVDLELLYGVRDDLSCFINIPLISQMQLNNCYSSGIGDIFFKLNMPGIIKRL